MKKFLLTASALVAAGLAATPAAAQYWVNKEVKDKFTDKVHLLALNTGPGAPGARPFEVAFECRNRSKFVFTVDAGRPLADKRWPFDLYYRVDDRPTRKVRMTAYTNSNTGGMNKAHALEIANDLMSGEKVVMRAVSDDNDQYDAEISLDGAIPAIVKAALACGIALGR